MAKPTTYMPEGYHTVTPLVIVKGAAGFIEYLKRAFGGVEMGRVGEDGAIGHAEVRIGDSVVMMFDSKQDWPSTPSFLRVYRGRRCDLAPGDRGRRDLGHRAGDDAVG